MSFPRYPKYKASGVEWLGEVPEHWEVRRLKNVLHQPITDGPHLTPEFIADGVPFLSVDAIQDGELNFAACRFISAVDHAEFKRKAAPRRDDILMGKAASTGKIARVKVDTEFSIWSPLALIRVKSDVSANYCEFVLKSRQCQSQIDVLCTSNTQKNISMGDIPLLALALPPLAEQRAIAAFLDRETKKIDELVAAQERLIELLKEKRQAVISHAVTKGLDPAAPMKPSGVEWLGDVPAHWRVLPLRWASRCCSGDGLSREQVVPLEDEQHIVPVFGGNGFMGYTQRGNAERSVLAVGRVGALCGNIHTLSPPAWITDNALILTPDPNTYDLNFLSSVLRARNLNEIASRTAQPLITGTQVGDQRIPTPTLDEQNGIMHFVNRELAKCDAIIAESAAGIALLTERRSALISAAVTGQIDVRNAVPEVSA
jgi:type I restriction enzyme S subunit